MEVGAGEDGVGCLEDEVTRSLNVVASTTAVIFAVLDEVMVLLVPSEARLGVDVSVIEVVTALRSETLSDDTDDLGDAVKVLTDTLDSVRDDVVAISMAEDISATHWLML